MRFNHGRQFVKRSIGSSGVALISALGFLVVTGIMVAIALSLSASERRISGNNLRTLQAQYAAEAGVERAVFETYFVREDDAELSLPEFRSHLDDLGLSLLEDDDEAVSAVQSFEASLGDELNYTVNVRRRDEADATVLEVLSTGTLGGGPQMSERFISESLVFAPGLEPGFGLLSENTGCVLCHTTISTLEAAYKGGALSLPLSALEDELRVRVGALGGFHSDRPTEVDSRIAGSVYVRGRTNLADAVQGIAFQEVGNRASDFLSNEAFTPFAQLKRVDCAGGCDDEAYATWYDDYPVENPPDGVLPERVALAVEDADADAQVSLDEWRGAIAREENPGRIQGGQKQFKANDENLQVSAGEPFLDKTSAVLSSSQSPRGIDGHLILEGSAVSPLVLDGDVYVSGDVVISGYVSGRGRLIAQGNVYVTGDIRYACDEDSLDFEIKGPTDCSYSEPETLPRIALAALGNIAIGPYQARQLGEEAKAALPGDVIAKRFSCADVEACTAGDSDAFYQDYHDPGSRALTNDSPNYSLSATMAQLALLNQAAFEGASGARFYKMRDDSPIYRCERSSATDSYCETYDDPRLLEVAASSLPSDANIFSLGPRGDWLAPAASPTDLASESALRERWTRNVESSSRASGALHIDGALQAGGAVLGYLPTGSNTAGELVLQGSLLASDTALLATGGAALLYDQRLESVLGTQDQQAIVLDRRSYRLLSETESERW